LSIDPDLAETNQPYVFTGDDPLNAEDPLGETSAALFQRVMGCLLAASVYTGCLETVVQETASVLDPSSPLTHMDTLSLDEAGEIVEGISKAQEKLFKNAMLHEENGTEVLDAGEHGETIYAQGSKLYEKAVMEVQTGKADIAKAYSEMDTVEDNEVSTFDRFQNYYAEISMDPDIVYLSLPGEAMSPPGSLGSGDDGEGPAP
jgi:hypothetical protein